MIGKCQQGESFLPPNLLKQVRNRRNVALARTDKFVLPDRPDDEQMVTLRQELRDLPQTYSEAADALDRLVEIEAEIRRRN